MYLVLNTIFFGDDSDDDDDEHEMVGASALAFFWQQAMAGNTGSPAGRIQSHRVTGERFVPVDEVTRLTKLDWLFKDVGMAENSICVVEFFYLSTL